MTADTLERLRELRLVRSVRHRGVKSDSTGETETGSRGSNPVGGHVAANRSLRLLRAAFNWGLRTGMLTEASPFKRQGVTAVRLTKEIARWRRLEPGEAERLLAACGPHLRALVEVALETACRRGELLNLRWSQVDLTRCELWLPADKTKTGKARRVPISTRCKVLLEMRRDALRITLERRGLPGDLYVLGNELGQRVVSIKRAWRSACKQTKITGLRFHDLRREAGSRWMEAGVPLATIQKWLGHTNISQTSTYLATTTAGEHEAMRRFEERIGRLTPIDTAGVTPHKKTGRPITKGHNSLRKNNRHHRTPRPALPS